MKALIMDALKLPTRPYCNGPCPEANLSKVVDDHGQNAGLGTFVDAMVHELDHHAHVSRFTNSRVFALESSASDQSRSTYTLHFENGSHVSGVSNVILNLPTQPLLSLLRQSPLTPAPKNQIQKLHFSRGAPSMKLYVLYDDAWWINELNLTYGYFNNSYAPTCQTSGTAVPQLAPISGRYHDGHVRCDLPGGRCRGLLEAAYTYDDVSIAFYRSYLADAKSSARLVSYPSDHDQTPDAWERKQLLDSIHQALVELHTPQLKAIGALEKVAALRPALAALSIWDRMSLGFGAGIHDWMRDARPQASCHSFTECQQVMPPQVLQPLGQQHNVFVANEAFGNRVGWCEGSLVMAENIMAKHFALPRPAWIADQVYREWVLFNGTALSDHTLSASQP